MKTKLKNFQDAFIENMDGDQLFTSLFADDHEGNKLMDVPGVKELKEDMKQKFNGIVRAMFEAGLEVRRDEFSFIDFSSTNSFSFSAKRTKRSGNRRFLDLRQRSERRKYETRSVSCR